jgi:hypothetical protein
VSSWLLVQLSDFIGKSLKTSNYCRVGSAYPTLNSRSRVFIAKSPKLELGD